MKESKNTATVGLTGIVVHETENTFKIVTKADEFKGNPRRCDIRWRLIHFLLVVIPKRNTTFIFRVPVYALDSHATLTGQGKEPSSLSNSPLDLVPSMEFDLYGNQFCFRSADRATRKFKHKETLEFT